MVLGVVAATAAPLAAPATAAPGSGAQDAAGARRVVTLVSGDRVVLDGDRITSLTPAPGGRASGS